MIGILNYVPFGRTHLFARVKGRALPEWAAEFDAGTWAQFFLKFTISHPAVTVVTPATSNPGTCSTTSAAVSAACRMPSTESA